MAGETSPRLAGLPNYNNQVNPYLTTASNFNVANITTINSLNNTQLVTFTKDNTIAPVGTLQVSLGDDYTLSGTTALKTTAGYLALQTNTGGGIAVGGGTSGLLNIYTSAFTSPTLNFSGYGTATFNLNYNWTYPTVTPSSKGQYCTSDTAGTMSFQYPTNPVTDTYFGAV